MTGRTVLIVDDSESNRIILTRCVRRAGYEARAAEDGPTALESIAASPPDLVLLDWMMPGLSGIELLKAIRASHSAERMSVIMCTARSDSRDVQIALAAGANDFISKPIDVPVAIARIEAQLQRLQATKILEAMNDELEQAVAQRTRALLSAAAAPAVSERADALEKILRLTKWLEESQEAGNEALRRACASSIAAAARTLAQFVA
jgi:DNA-binding response OmpR family regulator